MVGNWALLEWKECQQLGVLGSCGSRVMKSPTGDLETRKMLCM